MSKFWSPVVHTLTPYVPGEQPRLADLVKLNTNENPYGPSPRVLEALRAEIADTLRLYPDPGSERLTRTIARHHGLQPDQVFVGNGSDEVLGHVFHALLKHEAPLLFPDITYSFYPVYCRLYGIDYVTLPLNAEFRLEIDDYLRPNGGIIFPNPNAPTGIALPLAEIERLLARNPDSVVVIDEAYVDFGTETAVTLIPRFPNLLVVRTLSKSRSLAGLRVGYALGDAALIQALIRVKDSFNSYPLDRLAQAGAIAALEDQAYFDVTRERVMATRAQLVSGMTALGFTVLPSGANFVFARHASHDGAELAAALRARNIVVRHFASPARIAPYLRITIGTDRQNQLLLQALGEILG